MPSFLIVANQSLGSKALETAIRERLAAGDASFYVLVPASPIPHRMTWDEAEARAAALDRLQGVLDRLRAWAPMRTDGFWRNWGCGCGGSKSGVIG